MKKIITLLFALMVSVWSMSQNNMFTAKIIDASSEQALEFVSIFIKESYVGASSDEFGMFSLDVSTVKKSTIVQFQMLGYTPIEIAWSELKNTATIAMVVSDNEIGEVLIQPINVYDLLQDAVAKIPDNYYANPIGQEVFFRQTLYTNGSLNILEEAHFDILNNFQRDKLPKSVSVKKARGFVEMDAYADLGKIIAKNIEDDSIDVAETALLLTGFNPNAKSIANDNQSVFSPKSLKLYGFMYQGLIEKHGHTCHLISFDQKEDLKKTLFKGVLYLDTASLAIVAFKVNLSPEGVDYQKFLPLRIRLLIKLAGFKLGINDIQMQAVYEQYANYWVVKSGSFQVDGNIARGKGPVLNGVLQLDYYVDNNYPKTEFYNTKGAYDNIATGLHNFKDENFWKDTGVYIPTLSNKIEQLLRKKLAEEE